MKSSRVFARFALQLESVNQANRANGRQIAEPKACGSSEAVWYVTGLILPEASRIRKKT